MTLAPGDRAVRRFAVSDEDMRVFARLSGDHSRIHTDPEFAHERGYRDVIVYGGLLLCQLSGMVGEHLPGRSGTSVKWTIAYRSPLYVGEAAELALEIVHVSASTGLIDGKFRIVASDRVIATGTTQSIVPIVEVVP